jgi:hypothetical protein
MTDTVRALPAVADEQVTENRYITAKDDRTQDGLRQVGAGGNHGT